MPQLFILYFFTSVYLFINLLQASYFCHYQIIEYIHFINNSFSEWRTTWTDTKPYDLYYLAEFVPDTLTTKSKLKGEIYRLVRNINLFEVLRGIAYEDILNMQAQ